MRVYRRCARGQKRGEGIREARSRRVSAVPPPLGALLVSHFIIEGKKEGPDDRFGPTDSRIYWGGFGGFQVRWSPGTLTRDNET